MAKRQAVIADQGPPERRQHNVVAVEQDANYRTRLRILDQLEIDRLLHKRLISLDEHVTAEHFHRDLVRAGYIKSSNWSLDNNIRGDVQAVSSQRSDAMVKIGMAIRWLHNSIGRNATNWLIGVCINAIKVHDKDLPNLRKALKAYRDYESAWHNYEGPRDLPSLLEGIK
jgi:hypothetical protein